MLEGERISKNILFFLQKISKFYRSKIEERRRQESREKTV